MTAPVTDTEKLIWSVLEAERPAIRFSWSLFLSFLLILVGGTEWAFFSLGLGGGWMELVYIIQLSVLIFSISSLLQ